MRNLAKLVTAGLLYIGLAGNVAAEDVLKVKMPSRLPGDIVVYVSPKNNYIKDKWISGYISRDSVVDFGTICEVYKDGSAHCRGVYSDSELEESLALLRKAYSSSLKE